MKKKEPIEPKKTDFLLAKEISAFDLHQETAIEPAVVGNFRKYLRDFTKNTGKLFTTKTVGGKLNVIRIK